MIFSAFRRRGSFPTRRGRPFPVLFTAACLMGAAPVQASLVINPTFDATITGSSNAAAIQDVINQAILVYQSYFSDPITVNIEFKSMSSGLGSSSTWLVTGIPYDDLRGAWVDDATTVDDFTALAHLPGGTTNPIPGNGAGTLAISAANFKSLTASAINTPDGFDGTVFINTLLTDVGKSGTTGQYSLSAVVQHEVNEVLGLGSGLGSAFLRPEDLFRYTAAGARTYTTSGDDAYFSIDGGATRLVRLNQTSGGDYGDWWSTGSHVPQVQDAFGTPGAKPVLGNAELTALDVIGYDRVVSAAAVPIPAAGWLFLSALGGLLAWSKRPVAGSEA